MLTVMVLLMQAACSVVQKDTGYYTIRQSISPDSASKIRDSIRAIGNEVFQPFQYTGAGRQVINYRLLAPAKINEQERYPLVLVLHSSGRPIGMDNVSQLGVLAKLWARPDIRARYPAYVVAPQFPVRSSNYTMSPDKNVLVSLPDPCLTTALELIDSLKKVLPIDGRRVYVIGFSMGGSSTINSLSLRPDLFAAAISISGIPAFGQINALAKIPLWIVHGNADHENPMVTDSLFYRELCSLHDRQVRFWEVEHLDHDIYAGLYKDDVIPRWLFQYKKAG